MGGVPVQRQIQTLWRRELNVPFRRAVVVLSLLGALGLSAMEGKDLILLRGRLGDIKSVPDELQEPILEFAAWASRARERAFPAQIGS